MIASHTGVGEAALVVVAVQREAARMADLGKIHTRDPGHKHAAACEEQRVLRL